MFATLDQQRQLGGKVMIALIWGVALMALTTSAVLQGSALKLGAPAVLLALIVTFSARKADSALYRTVTTICLMAGVSVLVAAFSGHAWQIDMHMAYFAALATIMVYSDWRAVAAGTVVVAVHHLVLNFVMPALVFPGGADFARVVVHAVILLVEAGILIVFAANSATMFETSQKNVAQASDARAQAEAASEQVQQARKAEAEASEAREALNRQLDAERRAIVEGIATALERLAAGDLTYRIVQPFTAEYEKLRTDFNATIAALQQTMQVIVTATGGIKTGTHEISESASDLSRRTEQQAASLEQTAAALDQITATVRQTAEGADKARTLVAGAKSSAERSGEVVSAAISAMSGIEQSSNQIGQIIGVIDEIAFQTNLLALNAGKGFAVVAQEVRALAQRSAGAAKDIKSLISTSGDQVRNGVEMVAETGKALQTIVSQVSEITTIVSDIAASAREQATGLQEVNTAVNQMDQVTQQNAAMVEESTAASHGLAKEADELGNLVGRFALSGSGSPRPADNDVVALNAYGASGRGRPVTAAETGRTSANCSAIQSAWASVRMSGGAMRMVCSWVSLARRPRA
jgi:methyl-accepting chemotaxis protein